MTLSPRGYCYLPVDGESLVEPLQGVRVLGLVCHSGIAPWPSASASPCRSWTLAPYQERSLVMRDSFLVT